MKALVEACWAADYEQRPEIVEVVSRLDEISQKLAPTTNAGSDMNNGGCCCVQ